MTTFSGINKGISVLGIQKELPIFSQIVSDKDLINSSLIDSISEYRKKNSSNIITNVNANWRSGWELHKEPSFKQFINWIRGNLDYIFSYHLQRKYEFSINDMWAIQYVNGDYAQIHDHFPFHFSCVYYVEAEDGCSPIIFENKLKVNPEPGLLLVFPSLIDHEVPTTNKKRTVISLNIAIQRDMVMFSKGNFIENKNGIDV